MTVQPADGLSLAAEFPHPAHEQWQSLVEGVLRKSGKDVAGPAAEEALSTTVEDGLITHPLYTSRDSAPDAGYPGFAPFTRGGKAEGNAAGGWDVRQRHSLPDAARLNEAVLADLENGVTSLWLTVGGAGGIPVAALAAALDGVYLDLAPVTLDAGGELEAAATELLRIYAERGVDAQAARGNLGADPLGQAARSGAGPDLTAAVHWAGRCAREYPGLRALTVDALPYHEAGGSAAEELGASLATGVAYLRALTEAGLGVDEACAQLEFRYAATADQFLTIAKLRAARRLWARVAEVCGAAGAGAQRQHVVTSSVMMTRRDPWVNMLRTTLACLGAGVGGADSVTVLPFDHALGLPDAFARRIARNTSTILLEESHLARVIDPAGGSWYVERLTAELADAAWAFFQEIERSGGQAAALRSGMIGERLAATWAARSRDLARRKEPVTGVSEFPQLAERPVEREAAPAEVSATAPGGLPRVRRDEAFEALRARSDAHLAATGQRPRVFLAALGPAAAHTARASFASNLFQAGGIEPVHDPVPVDAATAADAFKASGATVACLCSSDALYAEQAGAVAEALGSAGALRVFLAGRPGGYSGVDEYVFAGSDVVAVLSSVLDRMGVA
ncbi:MULTISPECIES: methylmalonyl-CoA mutase small subunit [unclassified Streptomyces]|uniref:methylmalonyl-CoA mutase small subunit n=1 Tax=unclassified Streptomyces TaxID=2593676 RepID=UPI00224F4C4C|nr:MULTISPECIES: methylmalonyl-CoA mutase small subunit [unclassified Streptomyces]WSP53398.1 methylmalonyl-CoA mutase small subunit [Streptomyces sp. NBC_01241]WSU25930.1 methylmalonyl-CoA mutase small subunit [Streptomyces sp. NBC_01108]MCX4799274.1 methylmalonyl-CoA mutase small subunit [Streptomyces sp. NBC_01242]WSJ40457.1 methylmalonyl-CoA mutase small subunit [Streptomyces sp. NBC_01321]WSP66774.1 methylmalonyl-CoA mutase small subunit [Streptomyces sp. NBC_01240]